MMWPTRWLKKGNANRLQVHMQPLINTSEGDVDN
jgi:hypothetical protein